ncbi:MAG: RNA 2',3'-cyclic phosphodiesterase [Deltaproteobacteria bacterium]|nr:RNA 2',3'-cyclic phosphodiesterase [Deltaproteobacteria bacterium]
MSKQGKIRAFIAIELPAAIKDALSSAQELLRSELTGHTGLSWTKIETIHLTLQFLGDIDQGKTDDIADVLDDVAKQVHPFTLGTTEIGAFPSLKRPRVIWAGLNTSNELAELKDLIDDGLVKLGFEKEERSFKPHLTICRVKALSSRRAAAKAIQSGLKLEKNEFKVNEFSLFRSILKKGGAEHLVLKSFLLT